MAAADTAPHGNAQIVRTYLPRAEQHRLSRNAQLGLAGRAYVPGDPRFCLLS